jgi:hypothetical protein
MCLNEKDGLFKTLTTENKFDVRKNLKTVFAQARPSTINWIGSCGAARIFGKFVYDGIRSVSEPCGGFGGKDWGNGRRWAAC